MRRLPVVLVALTLVSTPLVAQRTAPGWSYTMNITFDSGDASHRGSMAMRYRTTAEHLRTDIVQVSGAAMPAETPGVDIEGMYNVLNEKDSSYVTIIPRQHAAMIMPNPMAQVKKMGMPTIAKNGVTTTTEDLGAGERILGHATHHYRETTSGTMSTTAGGQTCSYPLDGVTDTWVATDISLLPAMRSMTAHYGIDLPDSLKSKRSEGVALRSITRSSFTSPSGERRVATTTMEYTEISDAPIGDDVFAVPADYHVMDMRKMMPQISAEQMDSIRAARPTPANCHK